MEPGSCISLPSDPFTQRYIDQVIRTTACRCRPFTLLAIAHSMEWLHQSCYPPVAGHVGYVQLGSHRKCYYELPCARLLMHIFHASIPRWNGWLVKCTHVHFSRLLPKSCRSGRLHSGQQQFMRVPVAPLNMVSFQSLAILVGIMVFKPFGCDNWEGGCQNTNPVPSTQDFWRWGWGSGEGSWSYIRSHCHGPHLLGSLLSAMQKS